MTITTHSQRFNMQIDGKLIKKNGHDYLMDVLNLPEYYGKNLEDYLYVEFGNKTQNEIEFENITPIPFWSDIM